MTGTGISAYRRAGRPVWYVAYCCPHSLRRVCRATDWRVDDPQGKLKALAFAYECEREGLEFKDVAKPSRWDNWVLPYLREKYEFQALTLRSYETAWNYWRAFLLERNVPTPAVVTYMHVLGFIEWRQKLRKRSGRFPKKNTAIHNVKVLSLLMRHAVRMGWARSNPVASPGLRKAPQPEKPELKDADVTKIRAALAGKREWMRTAFEIALHQGCRLRETQVPLQDVDLVRRTICFRVKGGHTFTTALHPDLVGLFADLKARGEERACAIPLHASRDFKSVFRSVGLPDVTFHCTRVTVITRMARAGVPLSHAMRFVHHANTGVHRLYQKLAAEDMSAPIAALNFQPGGSPRAAS